jgi:tetratricopeptide (TPR) repeat protein
VALLFVLSWFGKSPSKDKLACETALTQGSKLLAAGDLAGASAQSVHANVSCSGATRSKAEALQAAVLKAENSGSSCSRALKAIDDQLDNFQLGGARSRLDKLDKRCAADATAKKLRQRLATAQTAANTATDAVRRALSQRDANAADKAIDRLAGLNRDSDDLAGFRATLATLQAEQAAARQAAATPPAVTSAPVITAAPAAVQRQPAAPATPTVKPEVHNAKAEMAVSFIQDAETALSQGRFDAARTYLDSARRMDPNSPRLDAMARQIRERERQLMQQETTIR